MLDRFHCVLFGNLNNHLQLLFLTGGSARLPVWFLGLLALYEAALLLLHC